MAQTLPFVIFILASGIYILFMRSNFVAEEAITGKNIVVTGASTGIGEQLAYQYAKLKANLLITARREKQLQDVANKCKQLGAAKVEIVLADMSRAEDRLHLIQETEKHFGNKLDYLILNHAIFPMRLWTGSNENMTFLQHTLDTNFISFVDLASKSVDLLKNNKGHIGVVSAGCAKFGCPKLGSYSASKAALHGFFSAWRQELRVKEIPVSITLCVLGLIDTETAMSQSRGVNAPISPETLAASAVDTADAVIESVALKEYEMFYPRHVWYFTKLHTIFTTTIENFCGDSFLSDVKKSN